MKTLLLLRHAKSSWDDPALDDFDRPLARRGRAAAPLMGRLLAERAWVPDLALVSPALRTRQTWRLVAPELAEPVDAAFADGLYEASAEQILGEIRKQAAKIGTLLVLGHNPGLEELARRLCGPSSDREALAWLTAKFPTAALARFEFDRGWSNLGFGVGKLTDFVRPRDLE
ncbi:histidine phosphatase family protein [Aquamicrobium sp. LC103]|uniref:SixA phosphatase family protein n=1 Tax=Aquamicrobium sp. LC103 TaxID=1120658 RepID=UPI00063E72E3|nr:histidine phosphatase family protein [Aquamicrobium sp. LC103]TKT81380.1 histidine phosphatase family protein [Aquamicrobium sp. LC103]